MLLHPLSTVERAQKRHNHFLGIALIQLHNGVPPAGRRAEIDQYRA